MSETKQNILNAANQVVVSEGAGRLTLDAVAEAAGVSKGGLLYHYPNKDALIRGMITRMIDQFETAVIDSANQSDAPNSWLAAYVQTTFDPELSQAEASAGVLAAVANNPTLLEPLRTRYFAWQQQIEADGMEPALAMVLRLAADGLWFTELLGLSPMTEDQRGAVLQKMMEFMGND